MCLPHIHCSSRKTSKKYSRETSPKKSRRNEAEIADPLESNTPQTSPGPQKRKRKTQTRESTPEEVLYQPSRRAGIALEAPPGGLPIPTATYGTAAGLFQDDQSLSASETGSEIDQNLEEDEDVWEFQPTKKRKTRSSTNPLLDLQKAYAPTASEPSSEEEEEEETVKARKPAKATAIGKRVLDNITKYRKKIKREKRFLAQLAQELQKLRPDREDQAREQERKAERERRRKKHSGDSKGREHRKRKK